MPSRHDIFKKEEEAFTRLADLAGVPDDYSWGQRPIPSDSKRRQFFRDLQAHLEFISAWHDIYSQRGDIDFEIARRAVQKARRELRRLPKSAQNLIVTAMRLQTDHDIPTAYSYLRLLEQGLAVLTGKDIDRRKEEPKNYRLSMVCYGLFELPKFHGGKGIPRTGDRFQQALDIFRVLVPSGFIPNVPPETTIRRIKKQLRR
jgi:hypothetical protein